MMRFNATRLLAGAVALLATGACKDLDVTNPNNPDITRALASPADVQNLAISTVNSWYLTSTYIEPYMMLQVTADASTANFGANGWLTTTPTIPIGAATPTSIRTLGAGPSGSPSSVTTMMRLGAGWAAATGAPGSGGGPGCQSSAGVSGSAKPTFRCTGPGSLLRRPVNRRPPKRAQPLRWSSLATPAPAN